MKTTEILIDLEFTGLDNTYIKDNEIIQLKMLKIDTLDIGNELTMCHNYSSSKKISAYNKVNNKLFKSFGHKFSNERFNHSLNLIEATELSSNQYYGFGVQQDMLMLNKYGIQINIIDIREMLQLSKHEVRLATEGSGLETAYFIVTKKIPEINDHNGIEELHLIRDLFLATKHLRKKEFLTVMPHGHCAGMPLTRYIQDYRRAADGYRYNNSDLLSRSLSHAIEEYEDAFQYEEADDE